MCVAVNHNIDSRYALCVYRQKKDYNDCDGIVSNCENGDLMIYACSDWPAQLCVTARRHDKLYTIGQCVILID